MYTPSGHIAPYCQWQDMTGFVVGMAERTGLKDETYKYIEFPTACLLDHYQPNLLHPQTPAHDICPGQAGTKEKKMRQAKKAPDPFLVT